MRRIVFRFSPSGSVGSLAIVAGLVAALLALAVPVRATAADPATLRYDIGAISFADIHASPSGDDTSGTGSAARPFRSIARAWRAVEHDSAHYRTRAYRILLAPGLYRGAYLDHDINGTVHPSLGTSTTPIVIQSQDTSNRAQIVFFDTGSRANLTLYRFHYAYLLDFDIRLDLTSVTSDGTGGTVASTESHGDGFQCERCDHLLLRGMHVELYYADAEIGQTETIKLNQSTHVYLEESEFAGAGDNVIDAVAVRHGWWVRNVIHHARDWCLYAKGGSADIVIAANEVSRCRIGGMLAGQGTTMPFMEQPFLEYEAYHIKFINNIVHDTEGAGMGANGGFNILFAYNTLVRTGVSPNLRNQLLELAPGGRDCYGPTTAECQAMVAAGAWGPAASGDGGEGIPNRQVYFLNNLIVNPGGTVSPVRLFRVDGPRNAPGGSWSGPGPVRSDDGVIVRGNLIWTGSDTLELPDGSGGCGSSHPTCSASLISSQNRVNTAEPRFVGFAGGDYRPTAGSPATSGTVALPTFSTTGLSGEQAAILAGTLATVVHTDFNGTLRTSDAVGALVAGAPAPVTPTPAPALSPSMFIPILRR